MEDAGEGFARLYDEHVWAVYGFIGYRVSSREDAEDLTQKTFERALRAWDRFDASRGSGASWLLTIARNLVVDHHRADRSDRVEPIDEENPLIDTRRSSPEPQPSLGLDPDIEAALGRLSDRDRELIALRFGADLTGPEIAELTGLSLANVQQVLSRSLRKLRGDLERARG